MEARRPTDKPITTEYCYSQEIASLDSFVVPEIVLCGSMQGYMSEVTGPLNLTKT